VTLPVAEPPEWRKARRAAIARIDQQVIDLYLRGAPARREKVRTLKARIAHIEADPNWLPPRPGRRMPAARRVAAFWAAQPGPFTVHPDVPQCFRCGAGVGKWSDLERAHLVDRWAGGLDHAANLVMLCPLCHRAMPIFLPGEVEQARGWVLAGWAPLINALTSSGDAP
jgi:5-methylcytosine-specific restriction endonuclease McrA